MSHAKDIALLIEIADRALDADDRARVRKIETSHLKAAYRDWKARNGIIRVERDSVEWALMMTDTGREYMRQENAKRHERNAQKRLATAIRRYRAA